MLKDNIDIDSAFMVLESKGIGRRYQKMNLTEYPHHRAQDALNWVKNDAKVAFVLGSGFTVVGETGAAYDIFMLTAMAVARAVNHNIIRADLSEMLEDEMLAKLTDDTKSILCISSFYVDSDKHNMIAYHRLEKALSRRLNDGTPILSHFPYDQKPKKMDSVIWNRLKTLNKEIVVD